MRYDQSDRQSDNVEDRRGDGGGGLGGGGMQIPLPLGGSGGMSLTTMLVLGLIMWMFGFNPLNLLNGSIDVGQLPQMPGITPGSSGSTVPPRAAGPSTDETEAFVRKVLADTEDVWTKVFQSFNPARAYQKPTLVLYSGQTRTACGAGEAAMGPFYCPLDQKVYLDLDFYQELERRFHAPGQFAQAYVVAHEVGHHVQKLLGIADKVEAMKERRPDLANAIQVRMELQADCFAGVWATLDDRMKKRLQEGDVEAGLNAASQIGDDTLQRAAGRRVMPDSFTHGSSAQRVAWFKRGIDTGQIQACDTFSSQSP